MARSDTVLRRLLGCLVVAGGVLAGVQVACNTATLTEAPVCRGAGCSCEADPSQPSCRGFNERPEGGVIDVPEPTDAIAPVPVDASDASEDSGEDAI